MNEQVIWKFPIDLNAAEQIILIPSGARFLHFANHPTNVINEASIWMLVNPHQQRIPVHIYMYMTDEKSRKIRGTYIGTAISCQPERLVQHFFMEGL